MSRVPENIQELHATYLARAEHTNGKILEFAQVLGETLEVALVSRAAIRETLRQTLTELARVIRFARLLAPPVNEEIDEQARRGRFPIRALDPPCVNSVLHEKDVLERELGSLLARTRISDGEFPCFPLLPTEIRRSIWKYACINEARGRCIIVALYMKRVLLTDNLKMNPEYDTFIYGVRYDPNKSAPGKRYSRFATQLIYGSALLSRSRTLGNDFVRRLLPDNPELKGARKFFLNAGSASSFLDVA
ncbi:hypothetical protein DL764_001649 [Monosporascus ibericus]|uniref:2EXR domain-containing protein n=1 Tax=Monosporascus ibericus TaxID=155417 RepID=A0A4Q4TQD5_9PEZI|nr:hypothetical protein DL764_001649 [Monosporascus ibericus]